MPAYTFYLHDGAGTVPAFEIELLDNDTYAVVHGRKLLRERPRYSTVEITEGEREVGSVSRDFGAFKDQIAQTLGGLPAD